MYSPPPCPAALLPAPAKAASSPGAGARSADDPMRSAVDLSGPASVQPSGGPSGSTGLKLNCLLPCSSRLGPLEGPLEGPAAPMLGPTALAMEAWRDPVVLWDPERLMLVAATPGGGAKGCWWGGGRWKPPISADACRCAGVKGDRLMTSCCPSLLQRSFLNPGATDTIACAGNSGPEEAQTSL